MRATTIVLSLVAGVAACSPQGREIQTPASDRIESKKSESPRKRAIVLPGQGKAGQGAPVVVLNRSGALYRLDGDFISAGTAFEVTQNDITLDLNGRTVTYNDARSSDPVYGIYVKVGVDRFTVRNGVVLQGRGASRRSPALYFYGASWVRGPHKVHDLIIRTDGEESGGIVADQGYGFNNSWIYRTFIDVRSDTRRMDGDGAEAININAMNQGGVQIFDNIITGAHRAIAVGRLGEQRGRGANRSNIYRNRIQHERRKHGNKSAYGIAVAGRSHNVHVYENQIVSDDGRGIILDGLGQGVPEGTSGNAVYDNRIDVQYSSSVKEGAYVENNVYGIRNRYASGDNRFERNQILVTSEISGTVIGIYVGSDRRDVRMKNLLFENNVIVARPGTGRGSRDVNYFDHAESIVFRNNRYLGTFSTDTSRVRSATVTGNARITAPRSSPPSPPGGLRLSRFLDSYVLEWRPVSDPDVLEYVVYRDGRRIPVSPRGGNFYVDINVRGNHGYSVSSLRISGQEGPRSAPIQTNQAISGWASINSGQ